jgi:hypothetical protein
VRLLGVSLHGLEEHGSEGEARTRKQLSLEP